MNRGKRPGRYLSAFVILIMATALIALPAGGASAATEYTWRWQNPLPQGDTLFGVSGIGSDNVWAVGEGGTVIHRDGSAWSIQDSGTTKDLTSVSALDESNVWAVGDGGTIIHWDGTSWNSQSSGTADTILGVSALSDNNVWAAGWGGNNILHYDGTSWSAQTQAGYSFWGISALDESNVWAVGRGIDPDTLEYSKILHYDGTSWSEQYSGEENPAVFRSVCALGADDVWAVGYDSEGSATSFHYDGSSWTSQDPGTTQILFGVSGIGSDNVWAVGNKGAIVCWDGDSWNLQPSGTTDPIYGVSALDENNVWAVGSWGMILHWDGTSWSPQSSGTTLWLWGVSAADKNNAWAVGGMPDQSEGVILHWDGVSWSEQYSLSEQITSVSALSKNDVWAAGWGGGIFHWDGDSWSVHHTDDIYNGIFALDESNVWAVGGRFDDGMEVWRRLVVHYDGDSWSQQYLGSQGIFTGVSAHDESEAWAVEGSQYGTPGFIFHYDGDSWGQQYTDPLQDFYGVFALDAENAWAVGSDNNKGGIILHYDGDSWSEQYSEPLQEFHSVFALDAENVWAAAGWAEGADPNTGTVFHYDGVNWSQRFQQLPPLQGICAPDPYNVWTVGWSGAIFHGSPPAPAITSIAPTSGDAGTTVTIEGENFGASRGGSHVSFGEVEASSYISWSDTRLKAKVPGGAKGKVKVTVTTPGGTSNSKDFTVTTPPPPPIPTTWYLAEGTNAWGFKTYITIENPNEEKVEAKITYMDPDAAASGDGIAGTRTVTLPPLSQTTVSSIEDIGEVDFSTKVECALGETIAVDRTMFWTGEGYSPDETGYHNSIGASSPSKTWYLPEGSSAWGFETWTLVANPNDTEASITLTYMTEEGPIALGKRVPPCSRASYSMEADIGVADASICVESDLPVVSERSMYRNGRREGSCSIGAVTPAKDYFLAEGATGYDVGFVTYILVQNPQEVENRVTLTYQTRSGEMEGGTFTMGPGSRRTARVNDSLPPGTDVSTIVHGTEPLVAERAMYWDNGTGEAFHSSVGLDSPSVAFMLPDGQTTDGWETWTLVSNPNPGAVTVRVTYLPQNGGTPVSFTSEIPPGTRSTYDMADMYSSGRASILVESLDGARPVVCERAMYKNDRGAGTDSVGGPSD